MNFKHLKQNVSERRIQNLNKRSPDMNVKYTTLNSHDSIIIVRVVKLKICFPVQTLNINGRPEAGSLLLRGCQRPYCLHSFCEHSVNIITDKWMYIPVRPDIFGTQLLPLLLKQTSQVFTMESLLLNRQKTYHEFLELAL